MKLKAQHINSTFYHPDGRVIELSEDCKDLEDVYKVAPTLFEEEKPDKKLKK